MPEPQCAGNDLKRVSIFWGVTTSGNGYSRWWFQIFFMFAYSGKIPILANIFQIGSFNHHLGIICHPFTTAVYCLYLSLSKCCIGLVRLKVTDLQEPLLRELKVATLSDTHLLEIGKFESKH